MPRAARVVAEGVPHHITQRGNNRQDTFLVDEDRRIYLNTLRAKCRQHGLSVLGYCLMTNHVHLVATPLQANSLARALGQAHWIYARYLNKRYGRSGHLWQNRFYSCPLGAGHAVAALLYVDLNPLRAGLVGAAEHYPWSSANRHLGGSDPADLVDAGSWAELDLEADWGQRLQLAAACGLEQELRRCTYAGTPFGSEAFVADMERRTGRRLRPKPPGPEPGSNHRNRCGWMRPVPCLSRIY
jgi:putative transposase